MTLSRKSGERKCHHPDQASAETLLPCTDPCLPPTTGPPSSTPLPAQDQEPPCTGEEEMKTSCYTSGLARVPSRRFCLCQLRQLLQLLGVTPALHSTSRGPLPQERAAERCTTCSGWVLQPGLSTAQPQPCYQQKACRQPCDQLAGPQATAAEPTNPISPCPPAARTNSSLPHPGATLPILPPVPTTATAGHVIPDNKPNPNP